MNNEMNLTPRQLREILFYMNNQKMTVEELRRKLFAVEGQDEPIHKSSEMWKDLGIEK